MAKPQFTHLHVHSHYSLLDGLPRIPQLCEHVKELGMDSVAITDHGVLYGAVEFYKEAKKVGIKPIIGCEIYMAQETLGQKRPNIDNRNYHLTLLVRNEKGYKNLVKMITIAHLKGFYYKPRADETTLEQHADGLVCLSGCLQSKISKLIVADRLKEAEETILKYAQWFGKDNFYLELQDHGNIDKQIKVNKQLIEFSRKLELPLVATNDSHYLCADDADAQDILMLINTGADPNNPERLSVRETDLSMRTPEDMAQAFQDTPEAISNTQKIADRCNFDFTLGEPHLPVFPLPNDVTADEHLAKLCEEGVKDRTIEDTPEMRERLTEELAIIKKTGFASYFLIVQDFVNWAKEQRIVVGPGRGSAGGSLVSYLLHITDIDPLKHGLLFERFLNPEREAGLPDIDLDFTDRRRDEVIEYVRNKYGEDKVAQIITFGTMAARAVIRDVGRALQYPYAFCDTLAKMVPFAYTLDDTLKKVPEFKELYQTDEKATKLIDAAKKLEGVARHASTHACGVVISKDALDNIVPLQHPTQSDDAIVTQYEMHAIEDIGLLKMDFLGLKNLTVIEDTLARVYAIHGENIDISKIPLDNEKTYQLLQKALTTGIFQLESDGMKRYLKQLKPNKFGDIIAMVALYRPGPMQFIPEFIARKHGKKRIHYLHPKLEPILEETYGICVYQEQLLRIVRELAGFSLGDADHLRKAVGKKIHSLLHKQKEKMMSGMLENNIDKKVAAELWEWVLPFANYGFNKAHSVGYGTIAYQTAYLKANYPIEFMSALLTSERSDVDRIAILIAECNQMGVEVLPPDINESFRHFSVVPEEKKIRFGLTAIKNVGANAVEAIISERKQNGPFASMRDFISRVDARDVNRKSLECLVRAGAFDALEERGILLYNIEHLLQLSREIHQNKNSAQTSLFEAHDGATGVDNNNLVLEKTEPATKKQRLTWERELLGLYISDHPLAGFREVLQHNAVAVSNISSELVGKRVRVGGIISQVKKIITKTGKPMLFLSVEDLSSSIEVICFPNMLENFGELFEQDKVVFVQGRVDNRDGVVKIICDHAEEIAEAA